MGSLLIYGGYIVRALRWKIFLRPVRPKTSVTSLVSPTLVGFTGIALLGRAGEFIRPYLIARRTDLPFSSQLAVWAVERIFDIGAFARFDGPGDFPPQRAAVDSSSRVLSAISRGRIYSDCDRSCNSGSRGYHRPKRRRRRSMGRTEICTSVRESGTHSLAQKVREFGMGLNTIHGPASFLALSVVSVGMWYMIALAYHEVTHSYGVDALEIPVSQLLILIFASMLGSMLQLPAVGGGSQMATIATLSSVFDVPPEMAASCGILLWLVTFFAVVPTGLLLAHRERLSLRKLSVESHKEEEAEFR